MVRGMLAHKRGVLLMARGALVRQGGVQAMARGDNSMGGSNATI